MQPNEINATCPACGSPVRTDPNSDDAGMAPALTGAQVDAAYRMVAAVRAWFGRAYRPGPGQVEQSDLLQAARDFEVIEQGRRQEVVTEIGPFRQADAHRLAHEHAARVAGVKP